MDVSELGPFFAVRSVLDDGGWRPLRALLEGPDLDDRVRHVRTVLGAMAGTTIEPRVAASTMSLGLFARLVAPLMGARALGVPIPRLSMDGSFWQPVVGGPWPLTLTGRSEEPDLERALGEVVLPLVEVIAETYALSEQVLLGNIASAVFGAARMIAEARPDLADVAEEVGASLLRGPLSSTGRVDGDFVRSSCCLYYRIPGGGYCADCVLTRRGRTARATAAATTAAR